MIQELKVKTSSREEFLDITGEVTKAVQKSKIKSGVCHIFIPHTTAGVTINENADPSVRKDILRKLSEVVPRNDGYEHAEGNSDAHIKASMMGFCQTVFVENGGLVLGTWQGIYFCEFDGPRSRKIVIKTGV
ncbi:MAG: secondary thiamine-phosphate synthase enzyme YjbQ [Candidatus Firestonebacteria bacterium]